MHAIVVNSPGALPDLAEIDDPIPGPGDVLVRVERSSVNGFDAAVGAGRFPVPADRYPLVMGRDFAGVIAAVGPDAERFSVGEEVFGVVRKPGMGDGSFAELVTLQESSVILQLPDGLDDAVAGGLGVAGCSALTVVDVAGVGPGDVVLVVGATGGVGTMATQFAVNAGAEVIATGSGSDAIDVLSVLGASHIVDYRQDPVGAVRHLHPDGVDVVLHLAGDATGYIGALRDEGRLASLVGAPEQAERGVSVRTVNGQIDVDHLRRVGDEAAAGRLRLPIQHTYMLDEVPQALADFDAGKLGKLVVEVD